MVRVAVPYRDDKKVQPYLAALRAAGAEPVPLHCTGQASMMDYEGLLLMGGTDVNPSRYGQEPAPETDAPDDERDEFEIGLLQSALGGKLPVLAICRGVQVLNVVLGGTLIQHVTGHRMLDGGTHTVQVGTGTPLEDIVGEPEIVVNSRHHQALGRVGDGLAVCGMSHDGLVEAVCRPRGSLVLGVQWHPEDRIAESASDRSLFEAFAAACRKPEFPEESL